MHIAERETYDAIVIGSGITGGWAAKELTEKGLKTLLLERGRHIEHGVDYVTESWKPWDFRYRGRKRPELYEEYPVQQTIYAFDESTKHYFVNDLENPYTTDPDKPFSWIRGYHLGGRSIMWGRQCYRLGEIDFEQNAREDIAVDWPIRYRDIAPWYDYVERFVGISGQAEGLPQIPDGQFLPPMELNCAERTVKQGIERAFRGRRMTIGRAAHLTQPLNGRAPCQYRGQCERGCSYGAYFSSLSATLPAARATGNLTVRTDSIVRSIIYDSETDCATGVRVIDANTREDFEVYGRVIFLCASTLGSTQILLNSANPRFPDGLANSSGTLGHYLMDHHYLVGATGIVPGHENERYFGRRPNGIYLARFVNLDDASRHPDFQGGFAYQGGAHREGWFRGAERPGFGAGLKEELRRPGHWRMSLNGYGECLPYYDNYVELDQDVTDAWGIPALRIHCTWRENEYRMREDMKQSAVEMLEAAGCRDVTVFDNPSPPGFGIHEMGTARMGRDPATSVLNAYNQCHDVPNLFVTDGSCMTSSAVQNPSITYMALTARACDYAARKMRDGEL